MGFFFTAEVRLNLFNYKQSYGLISQAFCLKNRRKIETHLLQQFATTVINIQAGVIEKWYLLL